MGILQNIAAALAAFCSSFGFNNATVSTDSQTGGLIGKLPDFRARNQSISQETRKFQTDFKFHL
jgi:hypothetical protein